MSERAAKLLEQVLALPDDDRLWLSDRLREHFADDADAEGGYVWDDPEFHAEIERRLEEVEKNPDSLIDGEQVFAELRERYRKDRVP